MDPSCNNLTWSPGWVLHQENDELHLIAGPDRQISVSGLSPDTAASLIGWTRGTIAPVNDEEKQLVDQLVAMGILLPEIGPTTTVTGQGPLAETLVERLGDSGVPVGDLETSSLEIIVRSADGWPEPAPGITHLGVDNRLHHTVVLGPLVVPGVSACTSCLDRRTEYRWPTRPDPAVPEATLYPSVAAELTLIQIGLAQEGRSPLVNATIAWDLETGTSKHETLLKLPGCSHCDRIKTSGRIQLP